MVSTYNSDVVSIQKQTRSLPRSLAGVVQELELRQPPVVTRARLKEIAFATGTRMSEKDLVDRLVRLGWLLPLRKQDTWEFSPAARAGRYGSGDPWIELRALLAHHPDA